MIIDPIDGSLNAKRGALHYALSIAVADGPDAADVAFGFVHDFGAREQWWAFRGQGAFRNGELLDPSPGERRAATAGSSCSGSSPPIRVGSRPRSRACSARPTGCARSARSPSTLCQVAAARFDGMVTLARSRGVDAAAGQLIVREAGGLISFTDCPEPLAAPMDASPTSHLVAARSAESLPSWSGSSRERRRARAEPRVIDWILAEKIAGYVAGQGGGHLPRDDLPRWPASPSGG